MIRALTVAAVLAAAIPAYGCPLPDHYGGLEEQLYNQCEAQEKANDLLERAQRQQEQDERDCDDYHDSVRIWGRENTLGRMVRQPLGCN